MKMLIPLICAAQVFIFFPPVSVLASENPVNCRDVTAELPMLPFLFVNRESAKGDTSGPRVQFPAEVIHSSYKTLKSKLLEMETDALLNEFDKLIKQEQEEHGGLTGVRNIKATARSLILDLGKKAELNLKDYEGEDEEYIKKMRELLAQNPQSKKLWGNHYRNTLSALSLTNHYPYFFRETVEPDPEVNFFVFKIVYDNMTPTTDFRFYSALVQQEIMRRLLENPKKFLLEAGLPNPENEVVFNSALKDLSTLLYTKD